MEEQTYSYKSFMTFTIVSDQVSPHVITEELMLNPDRSFEKGSQSISRKSGSVIIKPHNLWEIESETLFTEEEEIRRHIEYFRSALAPKKTILKRIKEDSRFESSFLIWIETDESGFGIDLNEAELSFLSEISNRVHFSLIVKESL